MSEYSQRDFYTLSLAAAYDMIRKGDIERARRLLKELSNQLRFIGNNEMRLEIALRISQLLLFIGKHDEADRILRDTISSINEDKEKDETALYWIARVKAEIIKISLIKNEDPGAMLENALRLYLSIAKDEKTVKELLSFVVALYSVIKKKKGMYATAKRALKDALKKATEFSLSEVKQDFHIYVAEALTELAELEYMTNEKREASTHLFQALNIYLSLNFEENALRIANIIADILLEEDKKKAIDFLNEFYEKIQDTEIKKIVKKRIKAIHQESKS